MTPLAEALTPPSNLEFAAWVACFVGFLMTVVLILSAIKLCRDLFFKKEIPDGQRPVTQEEFEGRLNTLKQDLLAEINRPNLNYVTQSQLEVKLDRLEAAINRKIDEGGSYAHQREHTFNNTLQMVQLQLARLTDKAGLPPMPYARGPVDSTKGEYPG